MILVFENIRPMRTFAGVPLGGGLKGEWVVDNGNFWQFKWLYFFGNFRYMASNITWRYATPCRPVTDCKMNYLE